MSWYLGKNLRKSSKYGVDSDKCIISFGSRYSAMPFNAKSGRSQMFFLSHSFFLIWNSLVCFLTVSIYNCVYLFAEGVLLQTNTPSLLVNTILREFWLVVHYCTMLSLGQVNVEEITSIYESFLEYVLLMFDLVSEVLNTLSSTLNMFTTIQVRWAGFFIYFH